MCRVQPLSHKNIRTACSVPAALRRTGTAVILMHSQLISHRLMLQDKELSALIVATQLLHGHTSAVALCTQGALVIGAFLWTYRGISLEYRQFRSVLPCRRRG